METDDEKKARLDRERIKKEAEERAKTLARLKGTDTSNTASGSITDSTQDRLAIDNWRGRFNRRWWLIYFTYRHQMK
jgi:hypothetical protein